MAPLGDRTHRFNLMLSTQEHEMLTELADAQGVSAADVVRQLLRQAHRDVFAAPVLLKGRSARRGAK